MAATVRLKRSGSSPELPARLREEMERFPGIVNETFRRALYAWAKALEADRTGNGLEGSIDEPPGAGKEDAG